MNNTPSAMFSAFLTEQVDACKAKEQNLLSKSRKDEANFEKIRTNIFELFQSVWSAANKSSENPQRFFLKKLEKIPVNWQNSLEKAVQYDDAGKAHIETIKLEAAKEIKGAFQRIWGNQI